MSKESEIELIVDSRSKIGESPLWHADEGALYWIDVKAPALYRTLVDTRQTASWSLPSDIGGYALNADASGAIVGLRTGIFALDFATGALTKLWDSPFDPQTHRFNEGDCDATGRLWLGTMYDPDPHTKSEPIQDDLYSFTSEEGLVGHGNSALLHNGFAWSADQSEFFIAHSREARIYAYAFDAAHGRLGLRRILAEIPGGTGIPDGGAVDEDGFYWSAIHGGGRLHRYAPDGRLDRVIELPFSHPTMVAFGGPSLRDLYITSATHGKAGAPHEGGIFRLRLNVAGLPRRTRMR